MSLPPHRASATLEDVPARQIVIPVFPGVGLLDVTGPADVFAAASALLGRAAHGYRVVLAGVTAGPVTTSSGVRLVADLALGDLTGPVDTVLVPGALQLTPEGAEAVVVDEVVDWLRRRPAGWRRVASVCSGAHMLAAAGLLDGRPATTHWFTADRLAEEFPQVAVDPDPIFVRSGDVWTCAGVTSGMDLALAMVADDHGEELARTVAQWLVMYLRRPGGQSQFSVPLATPAPQNDRIRDLQAWVAAHPDADLSVPALARRARMSERHFARVFARETSTTPAAYVDAVRVEAARRLLEQSDLSLPSVAARCGFGSVETLHRTFRRHLGTTPDAYRHRFRLPRTS